MKKRWISLLISAMLCLFMLPAGAADSVYHLMEETIVPDADLPDNHELFAMYTDRLFYPERQISFFGIQAGNRLTEDQKVVYDLMKARIEDVAAGKQASTVISIDPQSLGFDNTFTAAELGAESITSENIKEVGRTALQLLGQQIGIDLILEALMNDCPYDLYWYDKTSSGGFRYTGSTSYPEDGSTLTIPTLIMRFRVAGAYQPSGYDESNPSVDTAKTGAAAKAVEEAALVVSENSSKSDHDKLAAYRDYICSAVVYDSNAADDSYTGGYGDPWQLIYVFDKNSSTNVVCEGYAKAFQYLCDLTTFKNRDIYCYSVSGVMRGGTGAGPHMWNIVTMEDGKNYLIDVTNSDEGTIGSRGGLFMNAPVSGGSIAEGYTFAISGQGNISYTYDSDTKMMWGTDEDSILKLADSDYVPKTHQHSYIWVDGNAKDADGHTLTCKDCPDNSTQKQAHSFVYSASESTIAAACEVCTYNGGTLTLLAPADLTYSGSAKEATYTSTIVGVSPTISYSGNTTGGYPVNADSYTASVTLGEATAIVEFAISPKTITPQIKLEGSEHFFIKDPVEPQITVWADEITQLDSDEYTVSYEDNDAPGTGKVIVTDNQGGNYTFDAVSETFMIKAHEHELKYEFSGEYVNVSCRNEGCTTAAQILIRAADAVYDGEEKPITLEQTPADTFDIGLKYFAESGSETGIPVDAGKYKAIITLDTWSHQEEYTVAQRPVTVTAQDQTVSIGTEINPDAVDAQGLVPGHQITATLSADTSQATGNGKIDVGSVEIRSGESDVTANYAITCVSGKLVVSAHAHQWNYSAEDNAITAICESKGTCSIESRKATVTVTGGTHTYDGQAKQATVTQNPENTFVGVAVSYSPEPVVNAGSYTATITLGNVSAADTLTIEKADGPAAPSVAGNYAQGESGDTYTYTVNTIDGAEYRMDDGAWQDSPVFAGIEPNSRHIFSARIKETENVKAGAIGTGEEVLFDKLPGSGKVTIEGWTYGEKAKQPVPASSTNGITDVTYWYESTDGKGYAGAAAPVNAGSYQLTATFAANDVYGVCTATAQFVIAKATPAVATPTGLMATYGDLLSSVALPEGWAWNDADGTLVGDAGSRSFMAAYTHPTEPDNYEKIEAELTIAVGAKTVAAKVIVEEGTYVYNGQPHEPSVTVYDGEKRIDDSEYTVEYSDNVNAGTAKAIVRDKDGGNYTVSGEGTFAIVQSATDLTARADKAEYTYGETITVTATGAATGSKPAATGFALLRALIAPADDQMALYLGDRQISAAVSADENGVYTMTYDTADKTLAVGSHTLTVRYAGSDDKAAASATVNVKISARKLAVNSAEAQDRIYEPGNTLVTITNVKLDGVIEGDDVRAGAAKGEIGSDHAGMYPSAVLDVTLDGDDAAFYEIASPAAAAVNVTISPKTVTADVSTAQPSYMYTGGAVAPDVVVKDGAAIIPSSEYTVEYSDNVSAGTATAIIKDKEGGNYVVSGTGSFVISKATVTITADSLSAFVGEAMPKLTYKVTGLMGVDQLTTMPTIACNPDMSTAGTYAISVSGAEAGENYEIVYHSGVLYVVTADAEGVAAKINRKDLTEVPDGLLNTAFDTVDKIVAEMERTLLNEALGYTAANTAHYDVKLQFSLDGGNKWIDATEDNVPAEGIRIRIPYPKGTGRYSHDFVVSHMFTITSKRLDTVAGEVEQPQVTKTDAGIEVTLKGLSPVSVAWKPLASASDIASLPQTGDHSSLALWIVLAVMGVAGLLVVKRMNGRREN